MLFRLVMIRIFLTGFQFRNRCSYVTKLEKRKTCCCIYQPVISNRNATPTLQYSGTVAKTKASNRKECDVAS